MGVELSVDEYIDILMDNQAAIRKLECEGTTITAKHVERRMKFIRDSARKGIIGPHLVDSRLTKADLWTKSLPTPGIGGAARNF